MVVIITVASFKGGVGKTTTAVHLAGLLAEKKSTLLIDGDPNRSSLEWSESGRFNFKVVDERQSARYARDFEHIVIDTKARPEEEDLKVLAEGCDLLIIPTTPDALSIKATLKMLSALKNLDNHSYKILITMSPPPPSHDGRDAGDILKKNKLAVFKTEIRRYQVYKKASLEGCLVKDVANSYAKEAWNDYQKIVQEIKK